jgi:putative glutamine amidotransferase
MTLRIGITLSIDRGKRVRPPHEYYYLNRAYARRVGEAGAIPLLLGPDARAAEVAPLCDALIISGGDDLPRSADHLDAPGRSSNAEDSVRVAWERELIDIFDKCGKPLLGICYGMQLINFHFGGTLYLDVRKEAASTLDHGGAGKITQHEIEITGSSALLAGLPRKLTVNSNHRQAIETPAAGFSVTARSVDGVIEAIEHRHLFGIEWHPETCANSTSLFARFVALARLDRSRMLS